MADSNPLAHLRDIHLPKAIGLWPLAFGWYLLFFIILALSCFLVHTFIKRQRRLRAKKEALDLLRHYEEQYDKERNSPKTAMQISELLRRVALAYFARDKVAGLQGEKWLQFLKESSKKIDFKDASNYLLHLPYMSEQDIDLKPLFYKARLWIKERDEHV